VLAQGREGSRTTIRNTHLPRRFRVVRIELATSLEVMRCMPDLEVLYSLQNICSARIQFFRS